MKILICFFLGLFLLSARSEPSILPEYFGDVTVPTFPLSVGRSSWAGVNIGHNSDAYKVAFFQGLSNELVELSGDGIFGYNAQYWSEAMKQNNGPEFWKVGRLECPHNISCYLFYMSGVVFLMTAIDAKVVDAKLVYARYPIRSDKGEYAGSGSLDSIFGDGIFWRQLPVTRFEETGIFCSSFIDEVKHVGKNFKRRVNPEGYIESIEVSDWRDCKAPW